MRDTWICMGGVLGDDGYMYMYGRGLGEDGYRYMDGRGLGEDGYMHMDESLCCSPEATAALFANWPHPNRK